MTALAGLLLSFFVRRRRMFVRARPGPGGRTVVDVGGLARSDAAGGFETEFAGLASEIAAAQQGSEPAVPARGPALVPAAGAGGRLPAADPPVAADRAAADRAAADPRVAADRPAADETTEGE
jgi:cytochrome c biogenesis protein